MKSYQRRMCTLVAPLGLVLAVLFTCDPEVGAAAIPIPTEPATYRQTFRFDASALNPRPKSVNLYGTFNNWSKIDIPMVDVGSGIYYVTISLTPGLYHYKFLVDEDRSVADPTSDPTLDDPDDHHNSGVIVGTDARNWPPAPPDEIEPRGLAHDPTTNADSNVATPSILRLRIRTAADAVQTVTAWFRTPGQPLWHHQSLDAIEDHNLGFDRYGTVLTVNGPRVEYFFELTHGHGKAYLADAMLYDSPDMAEANPYLRLMQPDFQTPEWAKHAVWYQIFVERFRNGDPSNDPPNTQRWQSEWYATLPGEKPGKENFYRANIQNRRYGGDLQGVEQELPYLRQLGVTALYLNPIFEADSSHKYDTRDYRHVDDYFGVKGSAAELSGETDDPSTWQWSKSDRVFLDLVQEAHRQGFKVIIDGVFNHVGKSNPLFQDVLKNGRNSPHAGWFEILDWGAGGKPGEPGGLQYRSWNGRNGGMPLIKKDPILGIANGPRQYILAIARRWLVPDGDTSRGVDGFRLDAADDIPHPFWIEFRNLVKSVKPDAYISGEVWPWAQAWLAGDQFDAVMNYQFAMVGQSFFANKLKAISPSQFDRRLNGLLYAYPLQVVFDQMNLYDSHDTDRVASWFLNPDHAYNRDDRLQEADSTYDPGKPGPTEFKRLRQAVDFQMSFVGAPMIYYGDEAGMWSPSDPSDRMPLWWKDLEPFDDRQCKFNQDQFDCYQRAIAVRRELPELQDGLFRQVLIDDDHGVYAFKREDGAQTAYVVINRSDRAVRITIPVNLGQPNAKYVDWLNPSQTRLVPAALGQPQSRPSLQIRWSAQLQRPDQNTLRISLPAYGTAILAPAK